MRFCLTLGGLFVALLALGAPALAADETTKPAEPAQPALPFDKGAKAFSLMGGCMVERTGEKEYLANVTAEYTKFVENGVGLGMQGVGYYGYDDEAAIGAGFNVIARWHFLRWERASLFGDILGGVMQLDNNFPDGGTHLNFTYQAGLGGTIQLHDSLHLIGGAKFTHVSNGFIEGRDRNPVFNSYGGYLGLMWTF